MQINSGNSNTIHLPLASSKLAFYLFADDTNIYRESDNLYQLQRMVNTELNDSLLTKVAQCIFNQVKMWLDVNRLSLNMDKTNFIIFKSLQNSSTEIGKYQYQKYSS